MAQIGRVYSKRMHDRYGWWAWYPPNLPLAVGDYLQVSDDGNIIGLGSKLEWQVFGPALPVRHNPYEGNQKLRDGSSRHSATSVGAGVSTVGGVGGRGSLSLSFSASGGFDLDFQAAIVHQFQDVGVLKRTVLAAAKNGEWERDWALVTHVLEAQSATLVVGWEEGSSVDLHTVATLPTDVSGINLASPELGLTASNWRGDGSTTLCSHAFPLYHCVRVRRKWYGRRYAELQAVGADDADEVVVEDPFDDEDDDDV